MTANRPTGPEAEALIAALEGIWRQMDALKQREREIVRTHRLPAAPAADGLDVEGIVAELLSAESAIQLGHDRLRKATATLVGIGIRAAHEPSRASAAQPQADLRAALERLVEAFEDSVGFNDPAVKLARAALAAPAADGLEVPRLARALHEEYWSQEPEWEHIEDEAAAKGEPSREIVNGPEIGLPPKYRREPGNTGCAGHD